MENRKKGIVREVFAHVEGSVAVLGLSTLAVVRAIRQKVEGDPHAASDLQDMVGKGKPL